MSRLQTVEGVQTVEDVLKGVARHYLDDLVRYYTKNTETTPPAGAATDEQIIQWLAKLGKKPGAIAATLEWIQLGGPDKTAEQLVNAIVKEQADGAATGAAALAAGKDVNTLVIERLKALRDKLQDAQPLDKIKQALSIVERTAVPATLAPRLRRALIF